ncbi:hypothetical protein PMAYCL1PPCAC_20780, partial [Pristionchus mayeri]
QEQKTRTRTMFKGFASAANRPKDDSAPKTWDDIFKKPSTEAYLSEVRGSAATSRNQGQVAPNQAPSAHNTASGTPYSKDLNGNTSLSGFSNTATRDDSFSDTCGSHFGSSSSSPTQPPGVVVAGSASSSQPPSKPVLSWSSLPIHKGPSSNRASPPPPVSMPTLSAGGDFKGFGVISAETVAANKASLSASTDSGTVTAFSSMSLAGAGSGTGDGFAGFGGNSAPAPVFSSTTAPARPSPAPVAKKSNNNHIFAPRPYIEDNRPGFASFGGKSAPPVEMSSTTTPAPSRDRNRDSEASSVASSRASVADAGDAAGAARIFRCAMNESVRTTSPNTSPSSRHEPRQSMRSAAAAGAAGTGTVKKELENSSGFTGFGTMGRSTIPSPPRDMDPARLPPFGGTTITAKHEIVFKGFGALAQTPLPVHVPFPAPAPVSVPTPKPTPAAASTSGFAGFGTMSKGVAAPATTTKKEDTVAAQPQKDTVAAQNGVCRGGGGFGGFGTGGGSTLNGRVSVVERDAAAAAPSPAADAAGEPKTSLKKTEWAGFGTFKRPIAAAEPPAVPKGLENDFAGFHAPAAAKSPPPKQLTSYDKVRMDFGTLHVSGPAQTMNILAEIEQKEEAVLKAKRKVHFEDSKEEKAASAAAAADHVPQASEEREDKAEASQSVSDTTLDTETEDESDQQRPMPWGKRLSLRKMLDGDKNKIVLVAPPDVVSKYFEDQVFQSYGCTYDNVTNTFYATSPGYPNRANGDVVALDGSIKKAPVFVTKSLPTPAAIAVYQAGVSVCTVTNRGIFVFTRSKNEKGDVYLSRQISARMHHRGIAATAGGGIVSCSNGKIRMFDGNVNNGQERVLAEANYDFIINKELFAELPLRSSERSNCCFIDIVNNRLAISDLQKHVISLWDIVEKEQEHSIQFVRAIDVAVCANPTRGKGGSGLKGPQIPLGKCAFASGIRLDAEGWVLCADADGRTIQIFDAELNFVSRVETTEKLPYISGLYLESGGHLMVCDRKSQMGGLRVYLLEAREITGNGSAQQQPTQQAAAPKKTLGFAA